MNSTLVGIVSGVVAACVTWLILVWLGKVKIGVSREVIVGIVSGILTSGVMWLATTLFLGLFLPWYHEHAYKGLDLSGKWRIRLGPEGSASNHLEMTADLKQVTDRVSGVLVVVFKGNSKEQARTYTLNGFRREQFLGLTVEKMSRKQVGAGTSLVEVIDVGNRLSGYLCAYETSVGSIRCDSCEWTRAD
jgi:hypothetical protein